MLRGTRARRRSARAGVVAVGVGALLCSCHRVNVTPLGSTHEGRRQFELTCNERAIEAGSCNERALAVCVSGYETSAIGYVAATPVSSNGQVSYPRAERVLLITCN